METRSGNVLENTRSCSRDSVRVLMAYDGSGRRVSKTRERKACLSETSTGATSERTYAADWERELVTHYTGIGTEVRESYSEGSFQDARVVANMPKGLGRYGIENASAQNVASDFEWYLKNHLGSTMLVYGTGDGAGSVKAAYDYRAFGEQITLSEPTEKVTENFTGKERDDETELNYFGARYQDPMIGLWISVDPKRQFSSPYLYVGNGMNPIGVIDLDGNEVRAYSIGFRASVGLGFSISIGIVRNTDDWRDCGFMVGFGVGSGVEIGVLPNTVPSTLMQGAVNSHLGKISVQNSHDLEGVETEIHVGFGAGAKLNGNAEFQNSEIGAIGGGVYMNKTSVFTVGDLLGNESTSLLPTSGPAPADNSNVAVPQMRDE